MSLVRYRLLEGTCIDIEQYREDAAAFREYAPIETTDLLYPQSSRLVYFGTTEYITW